MNARNGNAVSAVRRSNAVKIATVANAYKTIAMNAALVVHFVVTKNVFQNAVLPQMGKSKKNPEFHWKKKTQEL